MLVLKYLRYLIGCFIFSGCVQACGFFGKPPREFVEIAAEVIKREIDKDSDILYRIIGLDPQCWQHDAIWRYALCMALDDESNAQLIYEQLNCDLDRRNAVCYKYLAQAVKHLDYCGYTDLYLQLPLRDFARYIFTDQYRCLLYMQKGASCVDDLLAGFRVYLLAFLIKRDSVVLLDA